MYAQIMVKAGHFCPPVQWLGLGLRAGAFADRHDLGRFGLAGLGRGFRLGGLLHLGLDVGLCLARLCRSRLCLRNMKQAEVLDLDAFLAAPKFDFRSSPESGLNSDIAPCPFRAMCGRLRVGKDFLHVRRLGRCCHVFGL